MAGTGVVIVSHSAKLAEGLAEIVEEMNDGSVKVIAAGGADGGRIGTSAIKIQDAIESLEDCKNILIYADMGSSIISAETAIDMRGRPAGKSPYGGLPHRGRRFRRCGAGDHHRRPGRNHECVQIS